MQIARKSVATHRDFAGSELARTCYFRCMNIELRRPMTVEEYLAWSDAQAERPRTELINGQIVAMSPERVAHNRIKSRVYMALAHALSVSGLEGEVLTDGMAVPIDNHTAYEPDALVYLGAPLPGHQLSAPAPVVVVEVLSPTTAHHDTSAKLIGYFKLPSVQHYLVIDPERRTVTHHTRGEMIAILTEGALKLDPPGLALMVADLLGTP
jgi:Uma2 family endonuclease